MIGSKLLCVLATLDQNEQKRFSDFIQSPYFNKREAPAALYKFILELCPDFENPDWGKIFKKAFPSKKSYSNSYLRNVLSDLYILIESFLAHEHRLLLPIRNELDICYEFAMRDLFELAEKKLATITETLNQSKLNDDYYYDWLIWHDRLADWIFFKKTKPSLRAPILQKKIDNLIKYFWRYTLSVYGVILNVREQSDSYSYDTTQIEAMLSLFIPEQFADAPELLCEYYTIKLLRAEATFDDFRAAYDFLNKNNNKISQASVSRIYVLLANFLKKQEQENENDENDQLIFTLFLESIHFDISRLGTMSAYSYNSITYFGYFTKGSDWLRNFIAEYSNYLLPQIREGWRTFVEARLLILENNAADAINLLLTYDSFYELDYFYTKQYLLFAYYKTKNDEAFSLLLDTITHTLYNRKDNIPRQEYEKYKNTLLLLKKMYQLRQKSTPHALAELQQWFDSTPLFFNKRLLRTAVIELVDAPKAPKYKPLSPKTTTILR